MPYFNQNGVLMRIEELIGKLKEKPKEYETVILKVYDEVVGNLRQIILLIYGIPTLIAIIVSLLRGSIILPYILGLLVTLDFSLLIEYVRLRKLLEKD